MIVFGRLFYVLSSLRLHFEWIQKMDSLIADTEREREREREAHAHLIEYLISDCICLLSLLLLFQRYSGLMQINERDANKMY